MQNDLLKFYSKPDIVFTSTRGYYEEKINFFISELQKLKGKGTEILDIGCNDGKLTKIYSKFGNVLGIDVNKDAVKTCRKKGLKCLCTDVGGLPSSYDNYFDVVITGDIIEHIFETDEFLLKLHKILKKHGKLLLTTPNLASFGRRMMLVAGINPFVEFSTKLPSKDYSVGHIRYYTVADMELQLKTNGFKNINIYGDRINLAKFIHIPYTFAKFVPTLSRNMMVYAEK